LPPSAHTGALFVSIHNQGGKDHLVSAHTDIADKTELHTHVHEGGLMKMQQVEQIEVPAGATLELAPGGYHIMLIGLREPLREGMRFPVRLKFAVAGSVELEAEVKSMDAGTGAEHLHH
jgi:copper(I)-binding protein